MVVTRLMIAYADCTELLRSLFFFGLAEVLQIIGCCVMAILAESAKGLVVGTIVCVAKMYSSF